MAFFGLFGRNQKKTDEEAGDAAKKDAGSKKDEEKSSYGQRLAGEASTRFVDFFGNKPPETQEEKEARKKQKAAENSWRNVSATAFVFVVFVYSFCIQVWIISR